MTTQCTTDRLTFQPLGRREVVGAFDGGTITSDAGGLLLREVERRTGIIRQFAACFVDHRDPDLIEHRVEELVGQRVYALALGYEDLNDHDRPNSFGRAAVGWINRRRWFSARRGAGQGRFVRAR
jgi:hypothetical protein